MSVFGTGAGSYSTSTERQIELGNAFRSFDRITIQGNGAAYWRAVMPPSKCVFLFSRRISGTQPGLTYEVLAGSTGVVAGSGLPIYNLNSNSQNISGGQVNRVSSVGVEGTVVDFDEIKGIQAEGLFGGSSSGGSFLDNSEIRVFAPSSEFVLKMSNGSLDATDATLYLKWYEIPQKYVGA